jgi:hypothetical protein
MSGVKKAKLWWQYIIFFFDWSLFEQLLLAINTIVSIIFLSLSIVLPDTYSGFGTSQYHILFDVVATIANFTNVVCIILVAKKHLSNYVWGFVAVVTLGIVAYLSRNTGTCILNLAFYTPMQVIGFIMWYKHSPNKRIIQPRQLNIYQ